MSFFERDYIGEMRAIIDIETEIGPYSSAEVAAYIVGKLRGDDPELLQGFLDLHAEYLVRSMINKRDASTRAHARRTSRAAAFAQAAQDWEDGDIHALDGWLRIPIVVADGTRKPLSDLTAVDLTYAADQYHHRARENKMMAAFLRAVGKQLGTKVVSEVYSEDQLTAMWRSIDKDR